MLFSRKNRAFKFYFLYNFEHSKGKMHHFAFLDCCQLSNLRRCKNGILQLKRHFLSPIFLLNISFFTPRKAVNTASDVQDYTFPPAFCSILSCILLLNALCFGAKCIAFCCKQHIFSCYLATILYNYAFIHCKYIC